MKTHRFEEILSNFSHSKVAVLGDFFLDLYIHLDRSLSEFSLETHKEAFQAVDIRGQAGAAGVSTSNLIALGAQAAAIGYTGSDGNGFSLRRTLEEDQVNTDLLLESHDRFTPTYTKPMMKELNGENHELNRIDIINRSANPIPLNRALAVNLHQAISEFDGLLVVEQVSQDGFGTMSPLLRKTLLKITREFPEMPIIVDSRHFAHQYNGVSLKMNLTEAVNTVQNYEAKFDLEDKTRKKSIAETCAEFLWEIHQKPIFITLGEDGISGFSDSEQFYYPGYPVSEPIDIVGAGDAVLAGIGLSLCAGARPEEAAYIGNLVGSIIVQQIGTTGVVTSDQLYQRHLEYQNNKNIKD